MTTILNITNLFDFTVISVMLTGVVALLLTLAPMISEALIRNRARAFPVDLASRMHEEWLGELRAIASRPGKLAFAVALMLTRRREFVSPDEDHMTEISERPGSVFAPLMGRKALLIIPTIFLAVTAYAASFLLPVRYASETTILVVPQRVPTEYVRSTVSLSITDRLESIAQQILSRTRLERIIKDFDLYPVARKRNPMEEIVRRMRKDIAINTSLTREGARSNSGTSIFTVGFESTDPRMAMKVTERLASLFIDENMRDREVLAEGTAAFLKAQLEDLGKRLTLQGERIEQERIAHGQASTAVMRLDYEMMESTYKAMYVKKEEALVASNLERRQIGENFKILDPARLPEVPVSPNRLVIAALGALVGLCLGGIGTIGQSRRQRRAIA